MCCAGFLVNLAMHHDSVFFLLHLTEEQQPDKKLYYIPHSHNFFTGIFE